MPVFSYTAKNFNGELKKGEMEAADKLTLAQDLRKDGFVLTFAEALVKEKPRFASLGRVLDIFNRVSLADKMMLCRNLSILVGAGVSLNRALDILSRETEKENFKRIILTISERVRGGKPFSDSLEEFPAIFDELFTNMVRVGETGGNLEEVLRLLASHYEKEHELKGKVTGALVYPAVILVVMLVIGALMMIFVIPKLTKIFEDMHVALPFTTQIIIAASNLMANYALFFFGGLALLAYLLRVFSKTVTGQQFFHKILLHSPVLGAIVKKINSARMSRILSSLIESGVPMVRTLEISSRTLTNYYFRTSLISASQEVQKGKPLSQALGAYESIYPILIPQMIQVGEESGKLAEILKKIADFYEEEVANITKNLAAVIEPVLMVVIGGAVGFFAVSMIQPLYSLVSQAG